MHREDKLDFFLFIDENSFMRSLALMVERLVGQVDKINAMCLYESLLPRFIAGGGVSGSSVDIW